MRRFSNVVIFKNHPGELLKTEILRPHIQILSFHRPGVGGQNLHFRQTPKWCRCSSCVELLLSTKGLKESEGSVSKKWKPDVCFTVKLLTTKSTSMITIKLILLLILVFLTKDRAWIPIRFLYRTPWHWLSFLELQFYWFSIFIKWECSLNLL